MWSRHTEKMTLCKAEGGFRKLKNAVSILTGWGFKASEEFSSPNLELVSLEKDRMFDWLVTTISMS